MLGVVDDQGDEIQCSSRAVAQLNQDTANSDGCEAETNPDPLQWAKSAPPASAGKIHRHTSKDGEQTNGDDYDAELTLGDHGAHIIA